MPLQALKSAHRATIQESLSNFMCFPLSLSLLFFFRVNFLLVVVVFETIANSRFQCQSSLGRIVLLIFWKQKHLTISIFRRLHFVQVEGVISGYGLAKILGSKDSSKMNFNCYYGWLGYLEARDARKTHSYRVKAINHWFLNTGQISWLVDLDLSFSMLSEWVWDLVTRS